MNNSRRIIWLYKIYRSEICSTSLPPSPCFLLLHKHTHRTLPHIHRTSKLLSELKFQRPSTIGALLSSGVNRCTLVVILSAYSYTLYILLILRQLILCGNHFRYVISVSWSVPSSLLTVHHGICLPTAGTSTQWARTLLAASAKTRTAFRTTSCPT